MAIDTISAYYPKLMLPIYIKITDPRQNDYKVGAKYDIRIEDGPRQRDKGGKGPYNYVHEAVLIASQDYDLENVPDLALAFDRNTKSRSEVLDQIPNDDGRVVMLVFMRLDTTKDFVAEGYETIISDKFDKEDVETDENFTNIE